ncbi:MAG: PEP-CTERM sorting domain-containing protein [Candidatus Rokuibacteriota bacterium]
MARRWYQAGLPPLVVAALLLAAALCPGRASAVRIEYDIVSSQDFGEPPFSGLFSDRERKGDDDDDDDRGKHKSRSKHEKEDPKIFSDDLTGLVALSTDAADLFVDDQKLRVDVFSLSGTVQLCKQCGEQAISIELDPRTASFLEVDDDGELEGKIRLLLTVDGSQREVTISTRGKTVDSDSNFATPEFVSLLLGLDLDKHDLRKLGVRGSGNADKEPILLQAQGPVVPEPDTFALVGAGLLGLSLCLRRASRRRAARP